MRARSLHSQLEWNNRHRMAILTFTLSKEAAAYTAAGNIDLPVLHCHHGWKRRTVRCVPAALSSASGGC
jgi:hypothetical protein